MKKRKTSRSGGYVTREVSIDIPDREPNEDPVTDNQLRYIRKLAPDLRMKGGLESLGKWQASALIEQIKEERERLEDDVVVGGVRKGSRVKKLVFWVVVLVIVYYILKHVYGQ
jgi:hypothetical protein